MTTRSEIERVLDRYLAEGGEQVPDRVIDAALDQIDHIPQRRALRVPWRFQHMATYLKPALAGAAVIAALVGGSMFMTRAPTPGVGGPGMGSPSPSASVPASATASSTASPALTDTSNWVPFTSKLYGYEIARPPTWLTQPATRDWSLEADGTDWVGFGVADRFRGSTAAGLDTLVTAFADDVPSGMSEEEWIAAYVQRIAQPETCPASDVELEQISVDGYEGTIRIDECGEAQVFVFLESRVHVFAVWRAEVALLEAFLSTVEFLQ